MKSAIIILLIIACGCKSSHKLVDLSTLKTNMDSTCTRTMTTQTGLEVILEKQNAAQAEITVKHFALLPDTLRQSGNLTYLAKEEHYKIKASGNDRQTQKGYTIVTRNDSTALHKQADKQTDITATRKRGGISLWWLVLMVGILITAFIIIRRKFRW